MRSLLFETPPLDAPIEILGAAVVALDVGGEHRRGGRDGAAAQHEIVRLGRHPPVLQLDVL